MKRFLLRMLLSRYQFRGYVWDPKYRYDAYLNDTVMGYHVEALRYAVRGLRSMGRTLPYMRPSEKVALFKSLSDAVLLYAFSWIISGAFGFDEGDEDKFLKLRERSGPLPFLGTAEDQEDFKIGGWLTNQLLYLTLQTENELASITPFTAAGRKSYTELLDFSSLAMTKTVKNYIAAFGSLSDQLEGEDKGFYQQRVGPYIWQQGGRDDRESWLEGNKFVAQMLKSIGLTGKDIDPAQGITDMIKAKSK
jgi:hypothetical protein